MRGKVIKIVENFYMCVVMSIKFWWIMIRNFLLLGLAPSIYGAMSYFASPQEDRDLHQKINSDIHCSMPNVNVLSFVSFLLLSLWATVVILVRRSPSMILSVAFWVLASWAILLLAFLTILGLILTVDNFTETKQFYLNSVKLFIRCPQLTLTVIVLWIITGLLIIKQPIIGLLIMPGLTMAITSNFYRKLAEHQLLPDQNA